MTKSAECRSKFVAFHRYLWRFEMSEEFYDTYIGM